MMNELIKWSLSMEIFNTTSSSRETVRTKFSRNSFRGNVRKLQKMEIASSTAFLKPITSSYEGRFVGYCNRRTGVYSKISKTKFYKESSPLAYLKISAMTENSIWANDIQIFPLSRILNTNIFVAVEHYDNHNTWRRVQWLTYSGTKSSGQECLYISNYCNHYELVVRLMNCDYESLKATYSIKQIIIE